MKLDRIVRFNAGSDCIRFECIYGSNQCIPGGGGSHGRHGLEIRFVVKGEEGAVQFLLFTGWMPQYAELNEISFRSVDDWGGKFMMPADLGYHSKTPLYADHTATHDACEFCDGQPCYYDGSGLNANDAMYALVNGGDDGLWKFLEEYYKFTFAEAPYPTPVEYSKPLR